MNWIERLKEPKFWLLGLAAAIAALHLTLVNRSNDSELFATCLLFWVAAGSLLWERRQDLQLQSSGPASVLGALVLGVLLLRIHQAVPMVGGTILKLLPVLALAAIALLASGFHGIRQYWRELLIFALLAMYPLFELILQGLDLSTITAKASTVLLSYLGVGVQRVGTFLYLPQGRVEVYGACSGIHTTIQMLSISVLFLLMFPIDSWVKRIFCVVVAVLLGFWVNAARVALMAILISLGQKGAFEYWHGGDGSLVFSAISVLLFGLFCWLVFLRPSGQRPGPGAAANA